MNIEIIVTGSSGKIWYQELIVGMNWWLITDVGDVIEQLKKFLRSKGK